MCPPETAAQGLLELDVDVNSRENSGRTPLQVALRRVSGNEQVVQLLLPHDAKRPWHRNAGTILNESGPLHDAIQADTILL
jgi:hypothetical protein